MPRALTDAARSARKGVERSFGCRRERWGRRTGQPTLETLAAAFTLHSSRCSLEDMPAETVHTTSRFRRTRVAKWAQPRLAHHLRLLDGISSAGTTLFILALIVASILDSRSGGASAGTDHVIQLVLAGAVALFLIGYGLKSIAVLPPPAEAPSRRLAEIRDNLTVLEETLGKLVAEVDAMSGNAEGLERRLQETQRLLGLTDYERSAVFRELDRRDRASSRQNLLLFAAGVGAGVLTNLLVG